MQNYEYIMWMTCEKPAAAYNSCVWCFDGNLSVDIMISYLIDIQCLCFVMNTTKLVV